MRLSDLPKPTTFQVGATMMFGSFVLSAVSALTDPSTVANWAGAWALLCGAWSCVYLFVALLRDAS